jgi:hypothetical protein
MKRKLPLFLWLSVTIFPFNWLRQESFVIRKHFDALFSPEWIHILGHLIIFSALAMLFLWTYRRPLNMRSIALMLSVILITGGLQELLQLPAKGRPFGWPEVFDLGVDMVGGILGGSLFAVYLRWKNSVIPGRRLSTDTTTSVDH